MSELAASFDAVATVGWGPASVLLSPNTGPQFGKLPDSIVTDQNTKQLAPLFPIQCEKTKVQLVLPFP